MSEEHKFSLKSLDSLGSASEGQVLKGTLSDVKCIAKGGMSQIYRARQPTLDRYIVVKKLKDELNGNAEMLERFRREAKALASVLHQNVAHVYDFVEDGEESYIVMEYIEGIDLSSIIEKVGNLPAAIAASILLGVARGVSYIHAHSLIHRDLKPSNIRVTNRGLVKLMDFGIVMDIENHGLTRPGMMVGSPSYLSPEQVLGDPITPRADIFLLGIVFYEMLTGTRPFKDEGGETVFQRIREGKYIPLRQMQSNVPKAFEKMVRRMLQIDPDKRYSEVKELITDLEKFLGPVKSSRAEEIVLRYLDEEALLTPSITYQQVDDDSGNWLTRGSFKWIAMAVIIAGLAFGGGFFLGSHNHNPGLSRGEVKMPAPVPIKPARKSRNR